MSQISPLEVNGLTVAYNENAVLWNVSAAFPSGQLCAIVGPNGAGKSTLLKSCLGLIKTASGKVLFFGKTLNESRKRVAYVPQRSSVDWDFPTNVLDVVLMGIYGKLGWIKRPSKENYNEAKEALAKVKMQDFEKRQISQLSGGQQQRVFLARALIQKADLYLMDEPFAGVDATTEEAILRVLKELKNNGKTVVVVHHDLDTVREYFDHVTLLKKKIIASGSIESTFTEEMLKKTYR